MMTAPKVTREINDQYQIDYDDLMEQYELAPSMRDDDGNIVHADYYLVGTVQGIEYYTPNDEDWGEIIAVDHISRLAAYTGFLDMGDFFPGSDYNMVPHKGTLTCAFYAEKDPEPGRVIVDNQNGKRQSYGPNIPDLWHIAMAVGDGANLSEMPEARRQELCRQILEVWHMAHDLHNAATGTGKARIVAAGRIGE